MQQFYGYFIVNQDVIQYNVEAGLTGPDDIESVAKLAKWEKWEYNCPALGIHLNSEGVHV